MSTDSGYTPNGAGGYTRRDLFDRAGLRERTYLPDNPRMAPGRRTKSKVKNRPKFKIVRRLKGRKMKAKKKAAHKRGLGRNKKRRQNRGKKK
jgi:hypothetical protein